MKSWIAFKSDSFPAPYVAKSRIRYGLALKEIIPVQANGTFIIVGALKEIELDKRILHDDGYVDLASAQTLLTNGLDAYHTANTITRFTYAKPDQDLKKIDF